MKEKISERGGKTYKEILQTYDLEREAKPRDLKIPEGQTALLSAQPEIAGRKVTLVEGVYHKLRPKSINDLKKWMGLPDEKAKKVPWGVQEGSFSKVVSQDQAGKIAFNPALLRDVRMMTKRYVYGISGQVSQYVPILNQFVRDYITGIIIACLQDIEVMSGATLDIQPDVHSLCARHILIHSGGKLLAHSDLTIDCVSLTGG